MGYLRPRDSGSRRMKAILGYKRPCLRRREWGRNDRYPGSLPHGGDMKIVGSKPGKKGKKVLCDILFVFWQINLAWRSEGGVSH